MQYPQSLDLLVRERLRQWPQRPPGLAQPPQHRGAWLRGRPTTTTKASPPFLKFPGSERLRTLPDGLWLHFGGSPVEPFVDIFALEACSSLTNLLDKRSRFAPSTQSMMAVCPLPWLLAPVMESDPTPRWKATGVLHRLPTATLVMPVRDIRVLYALKTQHYQGFANNHLPHPHEYFMPMKAITDPDSHEDPQVQALVARASATGNFMTYT